MRRAASDDLGQKQLRKRGFQIEFVSHAWPILSIDFPGALRELTEVLANVSMPVDELIGSGGGEAKGTQRLRRALSNKGWRKTNFEISKVINGVPKESITHEIDHVRDVPGHGRLALEIEWNNKDPFFDRDLENFKRLHSEGVISVGIIVTRGQSLQGELRRLALRYATQHKINSIDDLAKHNLNPTPRQIRQIHARTQRRNKPIPFAEAWASNFVDDKFGSSTTHWDKLIDRIKRGVGNPCPLMLVGLPDSVVTFDGKNKSRE
jgi:Restriction endonuclease BglII